MSGITLMHGDCLDVLRGMAESSVDSVVCDPPYGLSQHTPAEVLECLTAWIDGEVYRPKGKGFMGASWDAWVPGPEIWRECLRVLRPGGRVLAFAGTRSMDLMSMAIRLAGFELRDAIGYAHDGGGAPLLAWTFGSGFPKSRDVSKAIDAEAGAEREIVGQSDRKASLGSGGRYGGSKFSAAPNITAPATESARQWAGWGSALKPAWEPIILARKPLIGTIAANVLAHGTGALNIDGCRVPTSIPRPNREAAAPMSGDGKKVYGKFAKEGSRAIEDTMLGRWPANLIHDGSDEVLAGFPVTSGGSGKPRVRDGGGSELGQSRGWNAHENKPTQSQQYAGAGSAAHYFYCAKASKRDRDDGLEGLEQVKVQTRSGGGAPNEGRSASSNGGIRANIHPTVKPTSLMRHLLRLVTSPGGVALDPFMGSGSTGKAAKLEGFGFIGIERDPAYFAIAQRRIDAATAQAGLFAEVAHV